MQRYRRVQATDVPLFVAVIFIRVEASYAHAVPFLRGLSIRRTSQQLYSIENISISWNHPV